MDIKETEKITILLNALQERYNATHHIRSRVEQICTWSLGILVAAAGLFIDNDDCYSWLQKLYIIVPLIVIFIVLRFYFLRDLERGFKGQLRTAAKIEKALKLFDQNEYTEDSIYPSKWENAGQVNSDGKFFRSSYLLLYVGFAVFIVAIILS